MTETIAAARPDLALYEAGRKSLPLAYVLWFFLGFFGVHRFYARAGRTGWALLGLHVIGWTLVIIGYYANATSQTETISSAIGSSTSTSIVFDGRAGVVASIGHVLRFAAWAWWLVDIVLLPGLVRGWNNRLAAGLGMAVR